MKVLLTGGSGDLGAVLSLRMDKRGDTAIRFDVRPPRDSHGTFVQGSILDRGALTAAVRNVDCIVHIAAWHGIHEGRGKTAYDFWDLNVRGTFEVCEAAARAGAKRLVLISSDSVRKPKTIYGQSKILSEQVVDGYFRRHGMGVVILRPRAFIPHWNHDTYKSFSAWAQRFIRGWVHIDDVADAVFLAIERTADPPVVPPAAIELDGAYEYSAEDLANWDADGPGSTFRKHYSAEDYNLAVSHGIDVAHKPRVMDWQKRKKASDWGFRPKYSLGTMLKELRQFGTAGPPGPVG